MLLLKGRKTFYPDLNESTLLTLPGSFSTLHSLALATRSSIKREEATQAYSTGMMNEENILGVPSNDASSPFIREEMPNAITKADEREHLENPSWSNIAMQPVSPCSYSCRSHIFENTCVGEELIQGLVVSKDVTVSHLRPSVYTGGSLKLYVEHAIEPQQVSFETKQKALGHSVEWLAAEDAERLRVHSAASIIDVETLRGEASYAVDDTNFLFVAVRETMVKIGFQTIVVEQQPVPPSGCSPEGMC